MVNVFDAFNDRAKEVLYSARDLARYYSNNYIGTEHVLLAVLKNKSKILEKVFTALNVSEDAIKARTEEFIQTGKTIAVEGDDAMTPAVKMVLKLAFDEAQELRHQYVGPEHIFLALIREGESIAYRVATSFGLTLSAVREKIREYTRTQGGDAERNEEDEYLHQYTRNLVELARMNKLDPVIGRDKEIERVIHILARRMKNNPVLIGEPGVGKTAIIEGLALRIVQNSVPEILRDKIIITLDMAAVLAGAKYMGEFEERLKKLIDIIRKRDELIVFIDEMHTLVGAGRSGGAMDAANILKPALARGEMQCVGATTLDEYRLYIEKDPALERRFQPVMVDEPSVEDTIEILKGTKDRYETFHRVHITDEAITAAVRLSVRYISDRFLPDKAVDLIDEAAAKVRLHNLLAPTELADIERALHAVRVEKETAFNENDFEKVATLGVEEKKLEEQLKSAKDAWEDMRARTQRDSTVRAEDVAEIVSRWSGVPLTKLTDEEGKKLLEMEQELHTRIIGQDDAVRKISDIVRASRAGLSDPNKPIGVFLFLGPTGVGKTELAKALTEYLYGTEEMLIRLDMSEYMESHSVAKMIGAPPGYVGYDEGGQLTEAVRRHPYSVVLFDEIEKAHHDVFNILLQMFDDGRLTDAQGRVVNFKNTIIIMTSNIASDRMNGRNNEDSQKDLHEELRLHFRPEFLNRIDEIITFSPLSEKEIGGIVKIQLDKVAARLREKEITLKYTDSAIAYCAKRGYDPLFGARPLKRVIASEVVNAVSKLILAEPHIVGKTVTIDSDGNAITCTIT